MHIVPVSIHSLSRVCVSFFFADKCSAKELFFKNQGQIVFSIEKDAFGEERGGRGADSFTNLKAFLGWLTSGRQRRGQFLCIRNAAKLIAPFSINEPRISKLLMAAEKLKMSEAMPT